MYRSLTAKICKFHAFLLLFVLENYACCAENPFKIVFPLWWNPEVCNISFQLATFALKKAPIVVLWNGAVPQVLIRFYFQRSNLWVQFKKNNRKELNLSFSLCGGAINRGISYFFILKVKNWMASQPKKLFMKSVLGFLFHGCQSCLRYENFDPDKFKWQKL